MRQRVVIALALCAEPELIIADEPTTALDVSVQAQIIALIKRLGREHGTAVMLVTHDMGVIAETADRVAVMYAGRIAEIGPVRDVVQNPLHPYAKGLMGAIPTLAGDAERLVQIPGSMPRLSAIPPGCAFNPRCAFAFDRCRVERPEPIRHGSPGRRLPSLRHRRRRKPRHEPLPPFVDVENLRRVFDVSKPWLNRVLEGGHREFLKAVDGVTFDIAEGRDLCAGRRIRLGQVHRRAHGGRPAAAELGRGHHRRRLDERPPDSRRRASSCAAASR